jgi:hypothetical protein
MTGENFRRFHGKSYSEKFPIKVDKKTERHIMSEISKLQEERTKIYEDDNLTDEEVSAKSKIIFLQIRKLIDSMY